MLHNLFANVESTVNLGCDLLLYKEGNNFCETLRKWCLLRSFSGRDSTWDQSSLLCTTRFRRSSIILSAKLSSLACTWRWLSTGGIRFITFTREIVGLICRWFSAEVGLLLPTRRLGDLQIWGSTRATTVRWAVLFSKVKPVLMLGIWSWFRVWLAAL